MCVSVLSCTCEWVLFGSFSVVSCLLPTGHSRFGRLQVASRVPVDDAVPQYPFLLLLRRRRHGTRSLPYRQRHGWSLTGVLCCRRRRRRRLSRGKCVYHIVMVVVKSVSAARPQTPAQRTPRLRHLDRVRRFTPPPSLPAGRCTAVSKTRSGGSVPLWVFRVFPIKVPPPLPSVSLPAAVRRSVARARRFAAFRALVRSRARQPKHNLYIRVSPRRCYSVSGSSSPLFPGLFKSHRLVVKQDVLVVRRGPQSPRDPTVVRVAALLQSTPKASDSVWVRWRLDASSVESVMFSLLSDH